MEKSLVLILVDGRCESAVEVQRILTEWGQFIKTRLGIHDGVLTGSQDSGLIILECIGGKQKVKELEECLNEIDGVKSRSVHLSLLDQ